jgi:hypothetical protein
VEFDSLDAWFEKGFRIRKQRPASVRSDAIRSGGGARSVTINGVKFSGNAKAANARAIIKKAPEVMVKITGNSTGLATVKHHLDYISRNGDVALENERGETIEGRDGVKGLREELKASQVPQESKRREFLHVLFSMPPGTPEREFKEAVRQFCKEEFATRQYVMAVHRDTDHMHAHVCVGTRDMERANEPRLSPRKADLSRWRLGFADKLRENGIEAAASERRHRFNHRKAEHPTVRQIRADNPKSAAYNKRRADAKAALNHEKGKPDKPKPARIPKVYEAAREDLRKALQTGKRPENPAQNALEKSRAEAKKVWQTVEKALETTGQKDLAAGVRELLKEAEKPIVSRNQELYDQAAQMQRHERAKDDGATLER